MTRQAAELRAGGWPAELVELYVAHRESLVRLAGLLLDDVTAREDVVQEAFVRLGLKRADREFSSELAYLRRIVVNLSRSANRRRIVAARHLSRTSGRNTDGGDGGVPEIFVRDEVVAGLRRLPRRQREALVLRFYGDLSLEDIAVSMQVSVGTVKSTLSKGAAAFAAVMEDDQ